jgi:hypothetical protein
MEIVTMRVKYVEGVGAGLATVFNPKTGKDEPAISLIIPKENPVDDNPDNEENYEDYFMSVAAAKALAIDLNDMINFAVSGKTPS